MVGIIVPRSIIPLNHIWLFGAQGVGGWLLVPFTWRPRVSSAGVRWVFGEVRKSQLFGGTNYFPFFFGAPTKNGLPQKGFPSFSRVTEKLRSTWSLLLTLKKWFVTREIMGADPFFYVS